MTTPVIYHDESTAQTYGSGKTYIAIVLDRSGSMAAIRDATISAFNEFVNAQKRLGETYFTLAQFDSQAIDMLYRRSKNPVMLNQDNYVPRDMTPLLDAIGIVVRHAREDVLRDTFTRKVLVVQTDGMENASKEFSLDAVRSLLKELENTGWQIIYLGAGIDAFAGMKTYFGTMTSQSVSYDSTPASAMAAGRVMTNSVTNYRSKGVVATTDLVVGSTDQDVKVRPKLEDKTKAKS